MKKLIGLLIIMSLSYVANAQFSAGVSGELLFPMLKLKNRVDFGFGPSVSVGYTFKNRIGISLGYEYLILKSLIPDYKQQSEYLSVKYNLTDNSLIPYAGLTFGTFQSSQTAFNSKLTDSYVGITPNIGIMFESGFISNLKFDAIFSYTSMLNNNEIKYLKFGFGLYYFFK